MRALLSSRVQAAVRRMIAATELQSPQANEALEEIKAFQKEDFAAMFT